MSSAKEAEVQALTVRVPVNLNYRLDAVVLRRRLESGRRVSRRELLLEILQNGIAEMEQAGQTAA